MAKWRVACYGVKGHQIHNMLMNYGQAELVATAAFPDEALDGMAAKFPEQIRKVRRHPDLDALLADDEVEVVSLCSPRRDEQADHAIQCLEAGKHVVAEKPVALNLENVERIREAVKRTGQKFHGMAGTIYTGPFMRVREVARSGRLGEIVQVYAMKSYPFGTSRPQDRGIDGGMVMQAGVHAVRLMEGTTGLHLKRVCGFATSLGVPTEGSLQRAASLAFELDNRGVAIMAVNYLNHRSIGFHGNDQIRIFGTEGMVEAVDGASRMMVVTEESPPEALEPIDISTHLFYDHYFKWLRDDTPVYPAWEDELRFTQIVILCQRAADDGKAYDLPVPGA